MIKKSFKDFVMEDLDAFFNDEEFAEEHLIDDEPLLCIVVKHNHQDHKTNSQQDYNNATSALFVDRRTVYVKTEDFLVPRIGSELTLDGAIFDVMDASEEDGVVRIELTRNES